MSSSTVHVGGKPFAVGLLWQKAGTVADARARARSRADRLAVDLVCYRRLGDRRSARRVVQYGCGSTLDGVQRGLPSLAATVAQATGGSCLGAWPTDDGRWVTVAIRDGLILPDTDQCLLDEDAARRRVHDLLDVHREGSLVGQFDRIIAPWDLAMGPQAGLAELVAKPACRLERIGSGHRIWPTVLFIAAITAAIWAILSFGGLVNPPAAPAVMSQPTRQAEPPPPPPWLDTVPPRELAAACIAALDKWPALPGFTFKSLNCTSGRAAVEYLRQGGSLLLLRGSDARAVDANRIEVGLPGFPLSRRPRDDEAAPRDVSRLVPGVAQLFGLSFDVREAVAPKPPPGVEVPPPPPWRSFNFTLRGWTEPALIVGLLDVPTLVLESASFAPDSGWELKGALHAAR